jgi:hypothetical protein
MSKMCSSSLVNVNEYSYSSVRCSKSWRTTTAGKEDGRKRRGPHLSRREKSIIAMLCSIENTENKELRTTSAQLEKLLTPLLDLQHNLPFGRE